MPHLIIEYSANVADVADIGGLVDAVHAAALATGVAAPTRCARVPLPASTTRSATGIPTTSSSRSPPASAPAAPTTTRRSLLGALMDALDDYLGEATADDDAQRRVPGDRPGLADQREPPSAVIADERPRGDQRDRAARRSIMATDPHLRRERRDARAPARALRRRAAAAPHRRRPTPSATRRHVREPLADRRRAARRRWPGRRRPTSTPRRGPPPSAFARLVRPQRAGTQADPARRRRPDRRARPTRSPPSSASTPARPSGS